MKLAVVVIVLSCITAICAVVAYIVPLMAFWTALGILFSAVATLLIGLILYKLLKALSALMPKKK